MTLAGPRARAMAAARDARVAQKALARAARPLRARFDDRRAGLTLGAGFVGGVMLATLPPCAWARVGYSLVKAGIWLVRLPQHDSV